MYYMIENIGCVIEEDFILLGGSTKRNATDKIGLYGSGNKHWVAHFLKHKIPFVIYSGTQEVKITTVMKNYRGLMKEVIAVNGKETSITTDFGPDWKAWQGVREIICNALDEPGANFGFTTEVQPVEGKTRIFILITDQIKEILDNYHEYFAFDRTPDYSETFKMDDWVNDYKEPMTVRMFKKPQQSPVTIFRKGIRASEYHMTNSMLDYDLSEIRINESRIISSTYDAKKRIVCALKATMDKRLIEGVAGWSVQESLFESTLDYAYSGVEFSDAWYEYLKEYTILPQSAVFMIPMTEVDKPKILNDNLFMALRGQFPDLKTHDLYFSEDMKYALADCPTLKTRIDLTVEKIAKTYPKIGDIPIDTVQFVAENILGTFHENRILISTRMENSSDFDLTRVVLEEFFHKDSDESDFTRGFQNYLIKQIVYLLKT